MRPALGDNLMPLQWGNRMSLAFQLRTYKGARVVIPGWAGWQCQYRQKRGRPLWKMLGRAREGDSEGRTVTASATDGIHNSRGVEGEWPVGRVFVAICPQWLQSGRF